MHVISRSGGGRSFAVAALLAGGLLLPGTGHCAPPSAKNKATSAAAQLEAAQWIYNKCQTGVLDPIELMGDENRLQFLSKFGKGIQPSFRYYLVCRGLAARQEAPCAMIAKATQNASFGKQCRKEMKQAELAYAIFTGQGNAQQICRDYMNQKRLPDSGGSSSAEAARSCSLLIRDVGRDHAAAICDDGVREGLMSEEFARKYCPQEMLLWEGRPQLCGAQAKQGAYSCFQAASLIAALRARQAPACRANALCSAMSSHDLGACVVYLTEASRDICQTAGMDQISRLKTQLEKQKTFKPGQPAQDMPPDVKAKLKAVESRGGGGGQ